MAYQLFKPEYRLGEITPALAHAMTGIKNALGRPPAVVPMHILCAWGDNISGAGAFYEYLNSHGRDAALLERARIAIVEARCEWMLASASAAAAQPPPPISFQAAAAATVSYPMQDAPPIPQAGRFGRFRIDRDAAEAIQKIGGIVFTIPPGTRVEHGASVLLEVTFVDDPEDALKQARQNLAEDLAEAKKAGGHPVDHFYYVGRTLDVVGELTEKPDTSKVKSLFKRPAAAASARPPA